MNDAGRPQIENKFEIIPGKAKISLISRKLNAFRVAAAAIINANAVNTADRSGVSSRFCS